MGQLNTTEMYHLSVLGAASPIKRGRDHAPPDASVGDRFLASSSFWSLSVFSGLWQHTSDLCLQLQMSVFLCLSSHGLSSESVSKFPLLIRIPVTLGYGPSFLVGPHLS